jgi:hypothetical protein
VPGWHLCCKTFKDVAWCVAHPTFDEVVSYHRLAPCAGCYLGVCSMDHLEVKSPPLAGQFRHGPYLRNEMEALGGRSDDICSSLLWPIRKQPGPWSL